MPKRTPRDTSALDTDEEETVGSASKLPTYRRVAEDGVEVTQCPPMPALGYGFDDGELSVPVLF